VAYDEQLADRIRDLLAAEPEVTEKKMFGGLAFLVSGNMAVVASGRGGLMVRIEPDQRGALLARPGAGPMVMRGSELAGWLLVDAEQLGRRRQLAGWVDRGVAFARALPPK
jgi:TfoX/Sxy family transcriptional regulator of competence genes